MSLSLFAALVRQTQKSTDPHEPDTPTSPSPFNDDFSTQDWLRQEQTRILRLIGPIITLAQCLALLPTLIAVLRFSPSWSLLAILFTQIGATLAALLAGYLLHHNKKPELTALLLIGGILALSLVAALLFKDMVIPFAILGLLVTLMAGILVSPRAGYIMAVGLTLSVFPFLGLYMVGYQNSLPHIPTNVKVAIITAIYLITIYMGTYLVLLRTQSTHRALEQSAEKSKRLQEMNRILQQELVRREETNRQRLALEIEQERVRLLTGFIGDASHEFRTPLTVIKTNTYLLQRLGLAERQLGMVDSIQEQADYINDLVSALLEMARLDSGVAFTLTEVHPNSLIYDVVNRLTPALEAHDQQVIYDLDSRLPVIWADEPRLFLALTHLVRNALEHNTDSDAVTMRSRIQDDQLVIEVMDNGPGIAADVLPHIFERFYRQDTARTTRKVGLGLPIAKKIVERHKGRILVQTTPNEGSTFSIFLPLEHD